MKEEKAEEEAAEGPVEERKETGKPSSTEHEGADKQ